MKTLVMGAQGSCEEAEEILSHEEDDSKLFVGPGSMEVVVGILVQLFQTGCVVQTPLDELQEDLKESLRSCC